MYKTHNKRHKETTEWNAIGLLILCLPRTSKKMTILLPCMKGPFNYFWKVHSIRRIVLLLACRAWSVLFQAQDEWHYLLYSCLLRAASLAEGRMDAMPLIMLDMRRSFYQIHVHVAHLWCIFKFIGHLYLDYFAFPVSRPAPETSPAQEPLSSSLWCQKVSSGS